MSGAAPVPVGTRVRYHGSLWEYEDEEFTVVSHETPYANVAEHYPDGVAYKLRDTNPRAQKAAYLFDVRRGSFTPL